MSSIANLQLHLRRLNLDICVWLKRTSIKMFILHELKTVCIANIVMTICKKNFVLHIAM